MAGIALQRLPVPLEDIYHCTDENYPLVIMAVLSRIASINEAHASEPEQ